MESIELWRRLESRPALDDANHWITVYSELERSLEALSRELADDAVETPPALPLHLGSIRRRLHYWRRVRAQHAPVA